MVKFHYFFIKAIKDILSLDSVKLVLITGIPIFFIWIGLSWILWDYIVSFTTKIITWIPFSIIRANGAFILSFFIWFLSVMVSYAMFLGLFNAFLYKLVERRFFEFLNIFIVLSISVFWAIVILLKWHVIYKSIEKLLTYLPFQTVDQAISYLLALNIFYNFFVITLYFIVFLFKEPYLTTLKEIHYPEISIEKHIKSSKEYMVLFRDIFLFIFFTLLAIPVLFIPFANFLIILLLWAWLYKDSGFIGVCSLFCEEYEYEEIMHYRGTIWSISFVASALNLIPIISIFTPFLLFSLYFHWIMHLKKIRS